MVLLLRGPQVILRHPFILILIFRIEVLLATDSGPVRIPNRAGVNIINLQSKASAERYFHPRLGVFFNPEPRINEPN
jgi:hypothetical protein